MATEALLRVVDRADDGDGWAVRAAEGEAPLAVRGVKRDAVALARSHLVEAGLGGRLRVYLADGRLEHDREVAVPTLPRNRSQLAMVAETIDNEGGHIDHGFELVAAIIATGIVPVIAAYTSPEVQNAVGDGWMAVFLATLTWSLGCALSMVIYLRSGLAGWPLASACVISVLAASWVATKLGTGMLALESANTRGGSPLDILVGFAEVAVLTYGPVGALFGAGVGAWLGYRAAPLFGSGPTR